MRSLKKRGPHVLDDLMTSYFPYKCPGYILNSAEFHRFMGGSPNLLYKPMR